MAAPTKRKEEAAQDPRIQGIASSICVVLHIPKGIMFKDITTLLLDPKVFRDTIDLFVEKYTGARISAVAGIEARGFIVGPPIALAIGAKFIPLRKSGKLPGKVISKEYVLEYGRDCLEMHVGAVKSCELVLVVDDVIATGGTLCAAISLLERARGQVVECACVFELPSFKVSITGRRAVLTWVVLGFVTCNLREAVIIGSIIQKVSIPLLDSSAALLELAQMDYCGITCYFIKLFLDKKYALPYRVLDAVLEHFMSFLQEETIMPVIWHQSLLSFVQKYKNELQKKDKDNLERLM